MSPRHLRKNVNACKVGDEGNATPETHVALGGHSAAEKLGGEYIEDVLAGAVPKQRVIVAVVCNK